MASDGELSRVFGAYTQAKGDMDSRTFVKLCKDTGLVDKGFTPTDCDLIFTKVKGHGRQRIGLEQFEQAVEEIAKRKKVEAKAVLTKLTAAQGPQYEGTKAEAVRLHDDKSTFTGVHAHGGPSTVDKPMTKYNSGFSSYAPNQSSGSGGKISLQNMVDRSPADIRGVNKSFSKTN